MWSLVILCDLDSGSYWWRPPQCCCHLSTTVLLASVLTLFNMCNFSYCIFKDFRDRDVTFISTITLPTCFRDPFFSDAWVSLSFVPFCLCDLNHTCPQTALSHDPQKQLFPFTWKLHHFLIQVPFCFLLFWLLCTISNIYIPPLTHRKNSKVTWLLLWEIYAH